LVVILTQPVDRHALTIQFVRQPLNLLRRVNRVDSQFRDRRIDLSPVVSEESFGERHGQQCNELAQG
jgi:hypothetical protein